MSSDTPLDRTMRKFFCSTAIVAQLAFSFTAIPHFAYAASAMHQHKMRSAHFIVTAVEKLGLKVEGLRRKAQVYFVEVSQDGSRAIMAIDGYSAEIIGLNIISLAPGKTAKAKGTGGNHWVDITYVFGYVVDVATYESYTEVSSTEISVSEEYTEVSYEESEEVTYEEVEATAEADLDEGTAEDAAGDQEADANNDADDGTADDAYEAADDGAADEEAAPADDGDQDADTADDGAQDDGGQDDGAAQDDGGSDDQAE